MTNRLGKVLAALTDRHLGEETTGEAYAVKYLPNLNAQQDYDPGGMLLVGRTWVAGSENYRFGYQGSMKDDEIYGTGNSYTTHFRELDVRLMRWWSNDPKTSKTPWESPYATMGNNPVAFNDPLGDEIWVKKGLFKKLKYNEEDGKLYTRRGKEYTGDDVFSSKVLTNLNLLNSDPAGSIVVKAVSEDKHNYVYRNKSGPNSTGGSFHPFLFGKGGYINAALLSSTSVSTRSQLEFSSHELFHGYQRLKGNRRGKSLNSETEAYLFGAITTSRITAQIAGTGETYRTILHTTNYGDISNKGKDFNAAFHTLIFSETFDSKAFNTASNSLLNSIFSQPSYSGFNIDPNFKISIDTLYPLLNK